MRRFVVVGHEAPTDPDFPLSDLAGAVGRLDVLCRCVSAGLLTSHGVRDDASVWLVMQDTLTVRVAGATVRNLAPEERAIAGLVRRALEAGQRAVGPRWVEASPGISVAKRGLEEVLEASEEDGFLVQLHEDGEPVRDLAPPSSATFVLSDHQNLSDEEQALVDAHADARTRLSPTRLHADHAIVVCHHYLDTDGYRRF